MRRHLLMIALCTVLSQASLAKTQKAHDHGHAKLDVAVDATTVKITLEAPSESIFGFEHAPRTEAEKQATRAGMKKLESGAKDLFAFAAELGCEPSEVKVSSGMLTDPTKAGKKDGKQSEETHSDVDADYTFTCKKPVAGTDLQVGLIKAFPRLKEIKAQVLSGAKQFGTEINAKNATLKL